MRMPLDFVPSWFALVIHFLVDMILLDSNSISFHEMKMACFVGEKFGIEN